MCVCVCYFFAYLQHHFIFCIIITCPCCLLQLLNHNSTVTLKRTCAHGNRPEMTSLTGHDRRAQLAVLTLDQQMTTQQEQVCLCTYCSYFFSFFFSFFFFSLFFFFFFLSLLSSSSLLIFIIIIVSGFFLFFYLFQSKQRINKIVHVEVIQFLCLLT